MIRPHFKISSFLEILPLVEFILEEGISDQEAINLIESSEETDGGGDGNKWKQEVADNHEALRLDDEVEEDPFTSKVISYEVKSRQLLSKKALISI